MFTPWATMHGSKHLPVPAAVGHTGGAVDVLVGHHVLQELSLVDQAVSVWRVARQRQCLSHESQRKAKAVT